MPTYQTVSQKPALSITSRSIQASILKIKPHIIKSVYTIGSRKVLVVPATFLLKLQGFICGALHNFVLFVQFKNVKSTHGGALLLVKLQKSNTPPWVFFLVFKIVQMVPNRARNHILSEWVNHIFWYLYQWKAYCLGLTMILYWKTSHNLCSNNHLKYMTLKMLQKAGLFLNVVIYLSKSTMLTRNV